MVVLTRMKKQSLANKTLPQLPIEIIFEIFSHLPADSLHNHRTKFPLLDSPSFIKKHASNMVARPQMKQLISRYNEKQGVFCIISLSSLNTYKPTIATSRSCKVEYGSLEEILFDENIRRTSLFDFRGTRVIGSCYGLVCLAVVGSYRPKKIVMDEPRGCFCCLVHSLTTNCEQLLLWNPVTQEHYELAENQSRSLDLYRSFLGFGYDSTNDSFKVVVAKGSLTQFYDHSTNSWDSIETIDWGSFEEGLGRPLDQVGHFLRGALHWIVSYANVVALDLATKACNNIGLPHCCFGSDHTLELGVLQECLAISCNKPDYMEVGIWVMKEYGDIESWTKAYAIVKDSRLRKFNLKPPLWVSEDGEVLFNVDGRIGVWHPELEKFRFTRKCKRNNPSCGMIHVGTLLSPKPKINDSYNNVSNSLYT